MLSEVPPAPETAVLYSGGLDSAVLVAFEARRAAVLPIYVSVGLAWEGEELAASRRVLGAPAYKTRVAPLLRLDLPMSDVYDPSHWALEGSPPGHDTPDEAVYIPGRNVVLLSKAAVACSLRRISRLAIGPLAGNPFPDARPEFFAAMSRALSLGLAHPIEIVAPLATLHKDGVIALGIELGVPLEHTISCMNPTGRQHCGACSKCRERRDGFRDAGVPDPTAYRADRPR
jgi:7-cyano-7-deazaguanine synthase